MKENKEQLKVRKERLEETLKDKSKPGWERDKILRVIKKVERRLNKPEEKKTS